MSIKLFPKSLSFFISMIILFPLVGLYAFNLTQNKAIYIRINQLGFLPNDFKTGIVFSNSELLYQKYSIINLDKNIAVYSKSIENYCGEFGNFKYHYFIDFSEIKEPGNYVVEISNKRSFRFKIGYEIYSFLVDSLLKFFKVQRCGPTSPILHKVCHLYDSPLIVGDQSTMQVDVTGGWHDAGDYIKFLTTTGYATYLLLFAYEFDSQKFGFDRNKNGAPDILEEARVGLDWLLRCNYKKGMLITQVGDMKDHEVGWRLPEDDPLKYERTAYVGIGKNQVGLFTAVMSLASRIWKDCFLDLEFSKKCLNAALDIYSLRNSVADVDSNNSRMYQDTKYLGKLALGAIELFNSTLSSNYLDDAIEFGENAKSDYWWSWGDINSLAHYKIAQYIPRFKVYLENNLKTFNENKNKNTFGEGTSYTWGSNNTFLGIALQSILWKRITGSSEFDSLLYFQRDYILGRNPWGLSFIHKIGTLFPKNLHSQVAFFNKGYLPGAVTAGPAPKSLLDNFKINRENFQFNIFNSSEVLYFDDKNDYLTNEPTIATNATAIFVFGNFISK